jgi:hypothetical protein
MKVFLRRWVLLAALPVSAVGVAVAALPGGAGASSGTQCAICVSAPQTLYEIDGTGDGDARHVEVDIPLRVNAVSLSRIDVRYDTVDDTAAAPADFVAVDDGRVAIVPGSTVGYARVLVSRRAICQAGKHFDVVFSAPTVGRLDNAVTQVRLHDARCPS